MLHLSTKGPMVQPHDATPITARVSSLVHYGYDQSRVAGRITLDTARSSLAENQYPPWIRPTVEHASLTGSGSAPTHVFRRVALAWPPRSMSCAMSLHRGRSARENSRGRHSRG